MDEQESPAVVQAMMRQAKMNMTLYYSHPRRKAERAAQEKASNICFLRKECGCHSGSQRRFSECGVDRELVYNDELTAPSGRLTQR